MNKLFDKITDLFKTELASLASGHDYNCDRIDQMLTLMNIVYYLQHSDISDKEAIKLLHKHGIH